MHPFTIKLLFFCPRMDAFGIKNSVKFQLYAFSDLIFKVAVKLLNST